MACKACIIAHQLWINFWVWADKTLNMILLGDPNETVSRRTARARDAGKRVGIIGCKILAFCFGRGHCDYAEQAGSTSTEIWHWSDNFSQPELRAKKERGK